MWLIHRALETSADHHPHKIALIFENEATSYASLNTEANRVAHGLLAAGIGKGDSVAFLGANSREFLATHYGTAKAGAVFVPLNSASPPPEIRHYLDDARPRALVIGKSHLEHGSKLRDYFKDLAVCVAVGREGIDGATPYEAWLAKQRDANPDARVRPDDDYLMLYTGGTTGRPKGVVSTHGARAATSLEAAVDYHVTHADVGIHATPFFHAGTLNLGLHTKIMMGCTIVTFERFVPDRFVDAISRYGVTYLSGVPTLYSRLLTYAEQQGSSLRSVRKALYGASIMPEDVQRRALELWPGVDFFQGYGSTEAGQVSVLRPADHFTDKQARTGIPLTMVRLRVVGTDGTPVAAGEIGELLVDSSQIMRRYHNQPQLTAEVLAGGWYRTRDAATIDEDGYMTIVGRIDDMIVTGGENVFPKEVESVLMRHPAVGDALVVGIPDEDWVNAVSALVVLRSGFEADEKVLKEFCRSHIASYKKPKHIVFAAEVPKTTIGKPDRKAVATLIAQARRAR
jgi:fatty-acyl-CoA synthase